VDGSYWSRALTSRIKRRRALAASSGLLASAAFLAACGNDDETPAANTGASNGGSSGTGSAQAAGGSGASGTSSGGSGGLKDTPVDTTAQAKPGGTIKHWADGDAVHFDALASNANGVINWTSAFAYPRMLRFATPIYPELADGSLEGETAETFEMSGDRLTISFKLRQGMKWDRRDPTNGRVIDTEDVLFSWKKFEQLNPSAANMSANRSPVAPIESVTAPDKETIVVQLKQPDSSLLPLFASWDHFYLMPRESDGGFDPRNVIRGHGPWILEEHEPSVRFVWAKNPDYFMPGLPYADKLVRPIIPEYSSRLTQFRSGEIHTPTASALDIIQTKQDVPQTSIQEELAYSTTIWHGLAFGYEDDSPFKDARVRQATSMLVDPEAYVDVIDNRAYFRDAGMDLESARNSIIAAGWGDFWLDPADEEAFGPNAKYLGHDIAEAKALLAAAGYPNGFDYDMYFSNGLYGAIYLDSVNLISGMLRDGGLNATLRGFPYEQFKDIYYEAYYGPSYESGKTHGFNGIVHLANPQLPTVASHLFTFVHKDGGRFHGMTPDGNNPQLGDPKLNDEIEKLKLEFDRDKQIGIVNDINRYFTGQSYYVPRKAQTRLVTLTWPALANFNVFQPSPGENQWSESNLHWWIDETKAPYV
jgi:ABC-type transport system substrate-binding protein